MININKILLEEKNRILELHKTATKNHYLMEDAPTNNTFALGATVSLENKFANGSELKLFKGATFNIGNRGILYANTNWQKVGDLMGSVEGSGKGNIYYTCSSGKFSIGTEQKLPTCPIKTTDRSGNVVNSFQKCKNLFYIENIPTLTQKVLALCKLSETFVKGKPTENKPKNNKNTEQVKNTEVKTPEVKTSEVKSAVQPVKQTPGNTEIVTDVNNYTEDDLKTIAADIS